MTDRITVESILRWIPALGWMSWIFWLSSQQALPPTPGISIAVSAVAGHFILYAILSALLLYGFGALRGPSRRTVGIVALVAIGYALSDEYHQSFVPGRDASLFDLVVDAAGVAFTLTVWTFGWRNEATT